MTPLARALNALERLNARAARPDRQRDPSEPRAGGTSATEGDAGSDGGYDATELAIWGAGPDLTAFIAEVKGYATDLAAVTDTPKALKPDTRTGDCQSAAHRSLLVKHREQIDRHNATNSRLTAEVARLEHDWQRESNARDQDFADYTAAEERLITQRDEQAALIGRMTASLDKARTEVTQLAVELVAKDDAVKEPQKGNERLAETVERLWTQLQEAANVPDHNCPLEDPSCDGTYCNDNPEAIVRLRVAQERERQRQRAGHDLPEADESEIPWDVQAAFQTAFDRRSL